MNSQFIFALVIVLHLKLVEGQTQNIFTCTNSTTYCISGNCRQCPTNRPYCNNNLQMCTTTNPDSSLVCPRDGAMPSMDSCNSYTNCLNGRGMAVTCPNFSVFDPGSGTCQRGRLCYRFVCRRIDEGTYIPYPGDPSLYAFCSNGLPSFLQACSPGKIYDITTARCEQFCPGIGNFIDYNSSNCACYYSCTGIGSRQGVRLCCESNNFFSPIEGRCVSGDTQPVMCSNQP